MGESRALTELKEKYKSNPEILEFLQNITKSYHISIIHKVLMNDRIAKNINVQKLQNLIYGEKKDETLISILVETYGEEVSQTLKKYSKINVSTIENFDVFDGKFRNIFDEYTMEFILRNNMEIIDKMANDLDENSMEYYNSFENMIPNIFHSIGDIERKLKAFYDNIDTIKSIVDGGKKEEEIAYLTNKILKEEFEELKIRFKNKRDGDEFFYIANKIDANLNSGNDIAYTQIAILINLMKNGFSEYINIVNGNNFSEGLINLIRNEYGEEASELFGEELKDENILLDDNQQSKELRNYYYIKKIFNTSLRSYDKEGLEYIKKLKELKEKFKNNPEISEFLKTILIGNQMKIDILYSVLSNEKMAKNVDGNILEAICKNNEDSHKAISDLVGTTYGEEAGEILRERPDIKIYRDIPNFDIFDKDIREMIGYGGVHTFLTYYMESESIISEIAENKELIKYYKGFEALSGDYFPPSAVGLEERLIKFKENIDLVKQIVDSGKIEQYAEIFLEYLNDKENFDILMRKERLKNTSYKGKQYSFSPEEDFRIDSLEELSKYKEKKEMVLRKYATEGKVYTRDLIRFKYFGHTPNLEDKEKFLEDYLKFNKSLFTEDEIDLIEIYDIFSNIHDEEVLKTFDELLAHRKDVITSLKMRSINLRVAENYKTEYVDSLLTMEKAEEMVEQDEALISVTTNPIDVYELSQNKSRRYIVKKDDDNIYFADHKKNADGTYLYKDHIILRGKDQTQCLYKYRCENGEEIWKDIVRFDKSKKEYIRYRMPYRNLGFILNEKGEVYDYGYEDGDEELYEDFLEQAEYMISKAELIPQYNPEDEFKLEEGAAEGYILNGINSNELCVSLIRYNQMPTSRYFSYRGLNRS